MIRDEQVYLRVLCSFQVVGTIWAPRGEWGEAGNTQLRRVQSFLRKWSLPWIRDAWSRTDKKGGGEELLLRARVAGRLL